MSVTPTLPELLAGRYRLGRALGEGGMAKVFWAWDELLRVERAVKVLQPEAAESPLLRTRLLAEATAMARLNHPNVLRVMDLNADHSPPFVVMELAAGGSLADRLERGGPLPLGEATHLIAQVALALQAAHEAGIIHRDVKPQNILIGAGGVALLADFGIALLSGDGDLRTTRTNVAMGSMCFMAPEQRLDARAVGPAADVYAAACALYNLITDENPIDLFTAAERSPRWLPVPVALRDVLRQATAYDPEARPMSARQLSEQLLAALGENVAVPPELAEHTALALSWRPLASGESPLAPSRADHTFEGLFASPQSAMAQSSMNAPAEGLYTPTMPPAAQYTPTSRPEPPAASRVTAPEPRARSQARWIPLGVLAVGLVSALVWLAVRGQGEEAVVSPPAPISSAVVEDPGVVAAPIAAPIAAPSEPSVTAPPPQATPRAGVVEPTLSAPPAPPKEIPEAPTVGGSSLAGAWRGAFGGHVAQLSLRGDDDALRGDFVVKDRTGAVVVNSPVTGHFDAETQVLSLTDVDQSPADAARYTLRLTKPTRLEGESQTVHTRSSALVVLSRSPG
ncbi:MAG: protein kinase [Deltaproteobacteria bacterium]|nr:protein kinase [Deltaproteobacteria bacterium]